MPLHVEPVRTGQDLHAFVMLPWEIYRNDPLWVPPLIGETKKLFDPEKNPFFDHGDIKPFLARRDGRVVGRIAGIRNRRHEEFQDEAVGFFGFFECENDPEAAAALVEAAKGYVREQGLPVIRGPMNPSTNEDCGVLVDGFDTPPAVMMAHSPPYYDELLQGCGLEKAKDLLAYDLNKEQAAIETVARVAKKAEKSNPKVTVRRIEMKRFREEVEAFREVYNSAWERNWGFVPMTDRELDHMAEQLKPVIDPRIVYIAEYDGKPVGFSLALPDLHQATRHANGKLFPFGLLKILWHKRNIDRLRILVLGVVKEYRGRGIDIIMYYRYLSEVLEAGYRSGEFSWILEDNRAIRKPLEWFGSRVYKTYRIYEAPVGG